MTIIYPPSVSLASPKVIQHYSTLDKKESIWQGLPLQWASLVEREMMSREYLNYFPGIGLHDVSKNSTIGQSLLVEQKSAIGAQLMSTHFAPGSRTTKANRTLMWPCGRALSLELILVEIFQAQRNLLIQGLSKSIQLILSQQLMTGWLVPVCK